MPVPAPAPVEEPGFLDGLMDDPLLPLAGGGLLALLLGYGAYRVVQRRKQNSGVDSSFLESRIQPDSFFGASGGQRVDTANSEMTTGSSMAYSPSQLDAGGDVDPVAEADVYLAYGRDLQAEEILKEAVRLQAEQFNTRDADLQERKELRFRMKDPIVPEAYKDTATKYKSPAPDEEGRQVFALIKSVSFEQASLRPDTGRPEP